VPILLARSFLPCPTGSLDFGEIDLVTASALGVPAGPIRLQVGYPGPKGFGSRHVEENANRMKQLAQIGFANFTSFAHAVAQKYQAVLAGDPVSRFQLVYRDMFDGRRFDLRLIIQPETDGSVQFYGITTGIFSPVARGKVLCSVNRTGGCVPTPSAAERRSRFETLSLPNSKPVSSDNGS